MKIQIKKPVINIPRRKIKLNTRKRLKEARLK